MHAVSRYELATVKLARSDQTMGVSIMARGSEEGLHSNDGRSSRYSRVRTAWRGFVVELPRSSLEGHTQMGVPLHWSPRGFSAGKHLPSDQIVAAS